MNHSHIEIQYQLTDLCPIQPLFVDSTGSTFIAKAGDEPTTFYISDPVDRLYTGSPDILTFAPKPHGVIQVSIPVAQFCRLSGPLIFTSNETISSAGCNVSTGFGFKSKKLVLDTPGGWEVCASGRGPTAMSQVSVLSGTKMLYNH